MTDHEAPKSPQPKPALHYLPALTSRWWTALLGLSLMLNLLVGGIILGNFSADGPRERLMGASYVQLIPRRFLHQLPRERRGELMEVIRKSRPELRNLRQANEAISLKLADALSSPTYDEAVVAGIISEFATGSENLAARGGAVALDIVRRLTPQERTLLAAAIRARARPPRQHAD